ncbi:DUF2971 domain-containing protein [Dyella sp. C9]|uniref:DUF2971 domain-containing protein n=1 Tax=Dyella sp. C9 TaxID=2202154 RepID=UPI000DEF3337|nr:DUF2971 domain-containing protein [Dyella sp. C9]
MGDRENTRAGPIAGQTGQFGSAALGGKTMDDEQLLAAFSSWWEDANTDKDYPKKRPILAHYTSIQTLEAIVKGNELWLSNPLLMNDTQELRHGLDLARWAIQESKDLKAVFGESGANQLLQAFQAEHHRYGTKHAFDTYIASFSEHGAEDEDGLLSMWRGYGGNGSGAALIFKTTDLEPPDHQSPLILSRVHYGTDDERLTWTNCKLEDFCRLSVNANLTKGPFGKLGEILFNRFLVAALVSKHKGFEEEKEWRAIYLTYLDTTQSYSNRFHYSNGPRGVEPKFRLSFGSHPEFGGDLTMEMLVTKILLGPTAATMISIASVQRMLELLQRPELAKRVRASGIPYRAQ